MTETITIQGTPTSLKTFDPELSNQDPTIELQYLTGSTDKELTYNWHSDTRKFHLYLFDSDYVTDNALNYGAFIWGEDPANHDRVHRATIFASPARIISFDFDSPESSIEVAREVFKVYHYCLYTTRNHGKNKKGVTCDRFRLVLCTDRGVEQIELETIVKWYNQEHGLHCDTQAVDGARKFRMGTEDSDIWHNYGACFPVDAVLASIPQTFKDSITDKATIKRTPHQVLTAGKAASVHIAFIRSRYPALLKRKGSNASAVFSLMVSFFHRFNIQKEALKAALRHEVLIDDWYNRDYYQWQDVDKTINKAADYYLHNLETEQELSIQPDAQIEKTHVPFIPKPLNLDTVDVEALPITEEVKRIAEQACKLANQSLTQRKPEEFYDETRLFLHMVRSHKKAIYGVQCGGGKSIIATAYSLVSGRKSIFVKPTVNDCFTQRRNLLAIGADKYGIQVFAGWDSSRCIKAVTDFCNNPRLKPKYRTAAWQCWGSPILSACAKGWEAFHNPKHSLCRTCGVLEDVCPFRATRNPKTMKDKIQKRRHSIMTHSRFLEWVHSADCPDLKAYDVWIDEEPSIYESLELNQKEMDMLKVAFGKLKNNPILCHLEELETSPLTGTIQDPVSYTSETAKSMQASIGKSFDPLTQTHQPTNPEVKRLCMEYLNFFRGSCDRYAIRTPDGFGAKIMWVRNRLNFELASNVYLLNASYNHSLVEWEGFTVVEPLKKKQANGIVIHCHQSNSTKAKLETEIIPLLTSALGTKEAHGLQKTLLCLNKEPSATITEAVETFNGDVKLSGFQPASVANRGTIIGRNDWQDHDHVIAAFGIFSSVSHIALLGSLAEGQEVEGERVWVQKAIQGKTVQTPRMGKQGFTDGTLRLADRRLYCHELYQTIMRGIARNWKGDAMHVNTLCPSLSHILPIARDLPGVAIMWNGVDVMAIEASSLTKGDAELCKLFGLPDDPDYRREARELALELLNFKRVF